jgi:hypothetical protein
MTRKSVENTLNHVNSTQTGRTSADVVLLTVRSFPVPFSAESALLRLKLRRETGAFLLMAGIVSEVCHLRRLST